MNLDELWAEMERAPAPAGEGRLVRRIHPQAVADLYIALVKPADERVVMLTVPHELCPRPTSSPRRAERAARWVPRPTTGRSPSSCISSIPRHARSSARSPRTSRRRPRPRSRTRPRSTRGSPAWGAGSVCWRGCRPRGSAPSRSAASTPSCGPCASSWPGRSACAAAIEAWTGPEPALHDFQHARAAIEVKSTAGAQHQVLRISSERQLDDTGTSALYLVHVSIDARQGGTRDPPADRRGPPRRRRAARPPRRRSRIGSGRPGYLDVHARRYTTGYTLRRVGAYRVQEGFPRIVEADLLDGVGDVRYSVAVTECRDWERPLEELTARSGRVGDG